MQQQYQTVENREAVNERSIVEADFYAKRFKEFIFDHVFSPANDELSTHPISMNVFSSTPDIRHESSTHHQIDSQLTTDIVGLPQVHRL